MTISRARSSASFALDRLGQLHGVALRFVADGLEQLSLGLGSSHTADAFEGGNMLLLGAGQVEAALLEFTLAIEELAVALLEHVGTHVELFVAGQQPALESAELGALGAGFVFGLTLQPQLLVLGGEDQFLLLSAGFGDDPSSLLLRALDGLVGNQTSSQETNEDAHKEGGRTDGDHKGGFHIHLPPTRSELCDRAYPKSVGAASAPGLFPSPGKGPEQSRVVCDSSWRRRPALGARRVVRLAA